MKTLLGMACFLASLAPFQARAVERFSFPKPKDMNLRLFCCVCMIYAGTALFSYSDIDNESFEKSDLVVKGHFSRTPSGFTSVQNPGKLLKEGVELPGKWVQSTFVVDKVFKGKKTESVIVSSFKPENQALLLDYNLPMNQTLILFLKKDQQGEGFKQVNENNGWMITCDHGKDLGSGTGLEALKNEVLIILGVPDRTKIIDSQAALLQSYGIEKDLSLKVAASQYALMFKNAVSAASILGIDQAVINEKLRMAKSLFPEGEIFSILRLLIEHGDVEAIDYVKQLAAAGKISKDQMAGVEFFAVRGIRYIEKEKGPDEVAKYWNSPFPAVRAEVLFLLASKKVSNIPLFVAGLDDPSVQVRYEAFKGIKKIFPQADFKMIFLPGFEKDPDQYIKGCKDWLLANGILKKTQ